jgi:general secretion pathway protein J
MTSARLLSRRRAGFTLVELLIALAILSLLAVLGYRAVASLGDTQARLSAEAEQWRTLDRIFSRLEADCRQAVPRDVRTGDGVEPAWLATLDGNGNGVLRLSRAGSEFVLEPGSGGQRIGYELHGAAFQVLYWPALDTPGNSQPDAYTLADNVASLRLAYLDSKGGWRDRWPAFGESALPRGLRVTFELASGERVERIIALQ